MKPIYSLNNLNLDVMPPQIISLSRRINELFPVPVDNAIGTNDLDNAITLIKFNDKKSFWKKDIELQIVSKNFLKYVSGGDLSFLPVFSEDTIGYAQTRGFVLFNLKDKTFEDHLICKVFEESIEDVDVIDGEKRQFLLHIELLYHDEETGGAVPGSAITLKIIDFSSGEPKELSSYSLGKRVEFFKAIHNEIIFLSHRDTKKIRAVDTKFNPIKHPLINLVGEKAPFPRIGSKLYIHPTLPFAIVDAPDRTPEENIFTWIVTWKDENLEIKPLFALLNSTKYYQFSPDGNWFIFLEKQPDPRIPSKYRVFLMPVNENLPHYLGPPVNLGDVSFPVSSAWAVNPVSYTISTGRLLYRWVIGNAVNAK